MQTFGLHTGGPGGTQRGTPAPTAEDREQRLKSVGVQPGPFKSVLHESRPLQHAAPSAAPASMTAGRTPKLTEIVDYDAKREEIRAYFHAVFDKTEALFNLMTTDQAYYIKHEALRHPPIFYFGHTACFFVNKLILAKTLGDRINPKIEHMCAVGVDEMSWDDLNENHYDWPTVDEVRDYREQVRATVDDLISTMPLDGPINWDSPWWPIIMGIEHENIHIETSSAILRQCPTDMIAPNEDTFAICIADHMPPTNELLDVEASTVVYDKDTNASPVYGWDNEYGNKTVEVPAFKASKYLCSNAEFLEFVEAGGYEDEQWWGEEGWKWVQCFDVKHPKYWAKDESQTNPDGSGGWMQRQLAEETPLPWSWPAVTNQLEAKAFCNWKAAQTGKSIRLPGEDEWRAMRGLGEHGDQDICDWDKEKAAPANINLEHFASECPVDMFEWGNTGFYDVVGNVWQWTESPIDGLQGFKVHPLYDDFSTPTFDGKHTLFKGGSWISMGSNGATIDSRYSFRRHFFQHAGFRYIESDNEVSQAMNLYETDETVLQEIDAQYTPGVASAHLNVNASYSEQCASAVVEAATALGKPMGRVLDLNCSVGRRTFELAKDFDEAIGMDLTARHIQVAVRLQDDEIVRYTVPSEGTINTFHEVALADLELAGVKDKCHFVQQVDYNNLDQLKFGKYDVVLAANLLEKLDAPKRFLSEVHNFIAPGGLLCVASNYKWCPEATPVEEWVGGFKDSGSGENIPSVDGMGDVLKVNFRKVDWSKELTDVKRTTLRSMSVDVSEMTVWEKL